jgi:hypothetical protein
VNVRNPRLKGGDNMNDSKITGLIVAGLLAVLGTVAGHLVKGRWDINLAQKDFESKLILQALEAEDEIERLKFLAFLVDANLISDRSVEDGLRGILERDSARRDSAEQEEIRLGVPRLFRNPEPRYLSPAISYEASAQARIVEKYPELKGKTLALVGFRVRQHNVIGALAPIYAEVVGAKLKGKYQGDWVGGGSSAGHDVTKPGYVVTGIEKQRGYWFGRTEVVHMRIRWSRLTSKGIAPHDTAWSDKLGSGAYTKNLEEPRLLRASESAFILDCATETSRHTDGMVVIHDIAITKEVPVEK